MEQDVHTLAFWIVYQGIYTSFRGCKNYIKQKKSSVLTKTHLKSMLLTGPVKNFTLPSQLVEAASLIFLIISRISVGRFSGNFTISSVLLSRLDSPSDDNGTTKHQKNFLIVCEGEQKQLINLCCEIFRCYSGLHARY